MDEIMGMIKGFAGNFGPKGYMLCQGQTLSIAQNSALFAILGTTYGGDGVQTFKLPDLRGRAAVGAGQSPGTSSYGLGQVGGTENVTLNSTQMPLHTHTATSVLYAEGETADSAFPSGNMFGVGTNIYAAPTSSDNQAMSNQAITTTLTPAGGSQPFSVLNPYLAINFVICTQGVFPVRN